MTSFWVGAVIFSLCGAVLTFYSTRLFSDRTDRLRKVDPDAANRIEQQRVDNALRFPHS